MSIVTINEQGLFLSNLEDSELSLSGVSITPDYMSAPAGNTLQRPVTPEPGMIRFNTDTNKFEGYNGTNWILIQT